MNLITFRLMKQHESAVKINLGPLKTSRRKVSVGILRAVALWAWLAVMTFSGCTRSWYRQWADRDAYFLLESRQTDSSWELPSRPVEADSRSRMADTVDPDCAPKPRDDGAAQAYMDQPYGYDNSRYYGNIPTNDEFENLHWLEYLPRNEEGKVILSRDTAVELALLHSRDFQSQVEQLYLAALSLSSNRFEFDVNWFGGTGSQFNASGTAPNASRLLTQNPQLGLIKQLAAGGQLAATLANSFVWELGSNQFNAASGSLIINLTQPLLRGAFRHVRLESLTQAERNLLYEVRDFARFRRQFYLDITGGYRSLLTQLQSVRNQRKNLESLALNLEEHEYLFSQQLVSQLRVDQVFQNYQSGRIGLLATEQAYQNSLDAFKFQLGLPAYIEFELDESLLEPFQLNDLRLDELDRLAQEAYQKLIQTLPPEVPQRELLVETKEVIQELQRQAQEILPSIAGEFTDWKKRLDAGPRELAEDEERLDHRQQLDLAERIERQLVELQQDLEDDIEVMEKWTVDDPRGNLEFLDMPSLELDDETATVLSREETYVLSWRQLSRLLGTRLRERVANMFIAQTQVRLFQIEITPFDITEAEAVQAALDNRLDLKNQRAIVTDAFRRVEVAADALQSDLNVSATANLGTEGDNVLNFDSAQNTYQVGIEFDGPLNRLNERNGYRASQINYQATRRAWMALSDGITNQIRADLRSLRINWLNFQISRQQLIAATRQVDEAQFQLRTALDGGDSSLTQDLLDALQGLLGAKNNLISNWTAYEDARIELFVDLELLYLDENGSWINERYNPASNRNSAGTGESAAQRPTTESGRASDGLLQRGN